MILQKYFAAAHTQCASRVFHKIIRPTLTLS